MYTVVDLFAGAGGLSLGFTQTRKYTIVAAAENNPNARKTYRRNHKNVRLYSDVRTIDYSELQESIGNVDVVIGGPPCQGFSNANRQHSTIVSMNNSLVKEYVRAICELRPKAFVMENVAMLRSNLHRFIVDETDITDDHVMSLDMHMEQIELLPAASTFPEALEFAKEIGNVSTYAWADNFYKVINLLYRNRINQLKFDKVIEKYNSSLLQKLNLLISMNENADATIIQKLDAQMAHSILDYIDQRQIEFYDVISDIERPLMLQRMLVKMKEINENKIHVFNYEIDRGAVVADVQSYAVLDYVKGVLGGEPYNYQLTSSVLNAINYGAPQRRERFILVGIANGLKGQYAFPKGKYGAEDYQTVYDAISDLQDVPVSTDVNSKPIELNDYDDLTDLGRKLRGKLLYNHVSTATTDTALERFKALKEGQNFHDLDSSLKTTYSNVERTQNTIYMRLKYHEPSGTVVNVRKSMWIHPELDRAVSIREAARLQTFPDSFVFEGTKDAQYQQVGNAVPPCLAKAVACSLLPILDSNNDIDS